MTVSVEIEVGKSLVDESCLGMKVKVCLKIIYIYIQLYRNYK